MTVLDPYRQNICNMSVPNPDTPVQFYRSTRPKTPLYALLPENVDFIECSKCRHLFLPDTKEARAEHKRWHAENYGEFMPGCAYVEQVGGHYDIVVTCGACDSMLCPCQECQEQHIDECHRWKYVHVLLDMDESGELADILWDAIEADRHH